MKKKLHLLVQTIFSVFVFFWGGLEKTLKKGKSLNGAIPVPVRDTSHTAGPRKNKTTPANIKKAPAARANYHIVLKDKWPQKKIGKFFPGAKTTLKVIFNPIKKVTVAPF